MAVEEHESEMHEEEITACSFENWFHLFKRSTFKSEIIPLPEAFVRYLLADGIHVPNERSDAVSDGWGSGGESDDENPDATYHFPELEEEVRGAIGRLNGKVLPKLNWSAPKDAHWIHGSLKCTTPSEVFTLLKASDFISHDLCHAFDHCKSARRRPESFSLVLRRWHSLHESNEFRAFVRDSKLVAVSQRHTSTFFEHLTRPDEREAIMSAIQQFCTEEVLGRFSLPRFAFDVYVDIPPRRRVWLLDFSPWGASTEPGLFDWGELAEPLQEVELRVVQDETDCRSKLEKFHQMPLELAELSSQEGLSALLEKADRVLAQKEREQS